MSRPSTGRAARLAARLGLAVLLLAACLLLALPLAGYERYVITGGSMGGTIERGSVLWAETVPVGDLSVGDVITYAPPPGAGPDGLVTHRIVSIRRDAGGVPVFRTKGDANRGADPWTFQLAGPSQARAAFHVPYLGHVLSAASNRTGRTIVVGILALLVVVATLARLWRDAGEELRATDGAATTAVRDGDQPLREVRAAADHPYERRQGQTRREAGTQSQRSRPVRDGSAAGGDGSPSSLSILGGTSP